MKPLHCLNNLFLLSLKKRVGFFISFTLVTVSLSSQTPIQGVVNTYHKVIDIVPAKACIVVEDPTGLNINSMVMLVQMKGADINTTNTSAFGDINNINNAGNYEIGTICFIKNDSVFLFHTFLNNYTPTNGKVQLVQFAEYNSAEVVDTLKAQPWDSAAGTGGVIALYAINNIILNAPIYADSSGNKGGVYLLHNGSCTDFAPANAYFYNGSGNGLLAGAYKGESITNLVATQTGGRGSPANGGGGGNNHNNSGGGGANLSVGGNGGGNSSSGVPCTLPFVGIGGKALNSSGGTKIFMGGGGGAGNANNGSVLSNFGGKGGGIVFIWSNNLTGNGYSISVNGGNGGNSASDGAGGGGAGGTVIMNVTNYVGSLSINSFGGNGGNSVNDISQTRCFGGGGGGSGGAIYFTGGLPSITTLTNGGSAGIESNRNASCVSAVSASAGSSGNTSSNYTFSRSFSPAAYCRFLLPVKLISFHASLINKKVAIDWIVENPELAKFYVIEKISSTNHQTVLATLSADDALRNYRAFDNNPTPGNNLYRLKIIEKDNSVTFSEYKSIYIPYPADHFVVYPNPATNKITINGNFVVSTELRLTDISGKLILQQQLSGNSITINLPALSPGIYLLRIGEKTQKLIIH